MRGRFDTIVRIAPPITSTNPSPYRIGHRLALFPRVMTQEEQKMNRSCAAAETAVPKPEEARYFLIWAGLWIAALAILLPLLTQ